MLESVLMLCTHTSTAVAVLMQMMMMSRRVQMAERPALYLNAWKRHW